MSNEYVNKEQALEDLQTVNPNSLFTVESVEFWLCSQKIYTLVKCKDCQNNNNCDIQRSAQAGDDFFCAYGDKKG